MVDAHYSLEIAGSNPGYVIANRDRGFLGGSAQLAERCPVREGLGTFSGKSNEKHYGKPQVGLILSTALIETRAAVNDNKLSKRRGAEQPGALGSASRIVMRSERVADRVH
ncbi:UNVERIFIED_CONTAM: hypothetical protein FKN15_038129 [Acipenser sinensis]